MKARTEAVALIVFVVALTGCASSSMRYTPPAQHSVQTSKAIPTPFEHFWDRYVEELSKSFFVINNIEKESRIVNVSFTADRPGDYVDCGRTHRTSKHPASGTRTWDYTTADSSSFAVGIEGTNFEAHVDRSASLDGRVNIFMAPEGDGTNLSVNARYVWTVVVKSQTPYVQGYSTGVHVGSDTARVSFTSTQTGTQSSPQGSVTCVSTGRLEQQLLNLVAQ